MRPAQVLATRSSHLLSRRRQLGAFPFWQVSERAASVRRGFNFAHTSRHKRGTTHCVPTRKHQLVAFVVADDQRIERVVGGTRRLRAPVPCRTAPRADPDNDTLIYPLAARFAHLLRRMGIDQRPY